MNTPALPLDPHDPIAPLRHFVQQMTALVSQTQDEPTLLARGRELLSALIADDRWLPEACAQAQDGAYRQYLLHCDPLERFSVVSFVWGPGARTPIHNHTVWGLIGMLRGAELCREYEPQGIATSGPQGAGAVVPQGLEHTLRQGMIEAVSPTVGDWHVVANALPDRPSISVHVYGGNIGAVRRSVYDEASGEMREFISGYTSAQVPNLWDRSASLKAARA
jgi:predicted metal-dependent enzyme (double-stranded beta helix superfamily)